VTADVSGLAQAVVDIMDAVGSSTPGSAATASAAPSRARSRSATTIASTACS
jgi:hypothetical protein